MAREYYATIAACIDSLRKVVINMRKMKSFKVLGWCILCSLLFGLIPSGVALAAEDNTEHVYSYSFETGESSVMRVDEFVEKNSKNRMSLLSIDDETSYPPVPPQNGPAWPAIDVPDSTISPQYVFGSGTPWEECNPYIWGVASLKVFWRDGSYTYGSAFVFANKALATSAHVVYDNAKGGLCSRVEISCSRNGDSFPFGTIRASRVVVCEEYKTTVGTNYDYAILEVNEDIGSQTGWFGIGSNIANYENIVATGYPFYLTNDYSRPVHFKQYRDSGIISGSTTDKKTFWFTLDINNGSSGGPVYRPTYYAIGIISNGDSGRNRATGITGNLRALMVSYRDD